MKTAEQFRKEYEELIKQEESKKLDEEQLKRIEEFLDKQEVRLDDFKFIFPEKIRPNNLVELTNNGYYIDFIQSDENKTSFRYYDYINDLFINNSNNIDYDISKNSKDSRIDDVYGHRKDKKDDIFYIDSDLVSKSKEIEDTFKRIVNSVYGLK